jgi:hypothetical protein
MEEELKTIPVRPPTVKREINPRAHNKCGVIPPFHPNRLESHLKILTPVGTAITIVAAVKYARVSTSSPTVNMWCAHTTHPSSPIAIMAYTIPKWENAFSLPVSLIIISEITPNPGRIRT